MVNAPSTHYRKHVSKARAYKHANTPSTQARKHANTQKRQAREHASTPSTQFGRLLGLLYHLSRRESGRLANEACRSNPIVSSKQWFNGLKITNWIMTFLNISKNMRAIVLFVETLFYYQSHQLFRILVAIYLTFCATLLYTF